MRYTPTELYLHIMYTNAAWSLIFESNEKLRLKIGWKDLITAVYGKLSLHYSLMDPNPENHMLA